MDMVRSYSYLHRVQCMKLIVREQKGSRLQDAHVKLVKELDMEMPDLIRLHKVLGPICMQSDVQCHAVYRHVTT